MDLKMLGEQALRQVAHLFPAVQALEMQYVTDRNCYSLIVRFEEGPAVLVHIARDLELNFSRGKLAHMRLLEEIARMVSREVHKREQENKAPVISRPTVPGWYLCAWSGRLLEMAYYTEEGRWLKGGRPVTMPIFCGRVLSEQEVAKQVASKLNPPKRSPSPYPNDAMSEEEYWQEIARSAVLTRLGRTGQVPDLHDHQPPTLWGINQKNPIKWGSKEARMLEWLDDDKDKKP